VQLSFGRVLHPDEVAADKTLALFGRAAARDLVDVAALSERYPLERLCELAAEKDAGFDRRVFADALSAAAAHSDAAFAELGLEPETVAALRAAAARWRSQLLDAADVRAADAVQSFGGQALPGSEAPDYPNSLRPSERHRSSPSNAGRDGPSRSR
jgi:Nucleotidyl transferase AbiEii toxin, Type IV TA system